MEGEERDYDALFGERLLHHLKPLKDNKLGFYMYDKNTWVWTCDRKKHMEIIEREPANIFNNIPPRHQGKSLATLKLGAYNWAKMFAPKNNDLQQREAGRGFLVFANNGVLDLSTHKMVDSSHDSSLLYLTRRCDREYHREQVCASTKENILGRVFHALFPQPPPESVDNPRKAEYLLQFLVRAIAGFGCNYDQQFMLMSGATVCGGTACGDSTCEKSAIAHLLKNAFGEYDEFFSSEELSANNSKIKWPFMSKLWDRRLVVSVDKPKGTKRGADGECTSSDK